MWKRRLIWIALLLGALIFYLFENNSATLAALITCGILPPASFLLAYLQSRNGSLQIVVPEREIIGTDVECTIRSSIEGSTTLMVENSHTGELAEKPISIHKGDNSFVIRSDSCGRMTLTLQGIAVQDLFGLFIREIDQKQQEQIMILPELFPMELRMSESAFAMPNSDRYSPYKPGNDPCETFGMREYVPGDSIKAIHWKLSQKTEKTIVREMGLPIVSQVLLQYYVPRKSGRTPEEISGMTTVAASLATELAKKGIVFLVSWAGIEREILSEDGILAALDELLENYALQEEDSLRNCGGFSHVITVSPEYDPTLPDRFNGSRITLLSPGEGSGGVQTDGVWRYYFSTETMAEQLSVLEI